MRRAYGPRQFDLLAALSAPPPPPPPPGEIRQDWMRSLGALLLEVISYRRAQARRGQQEIGDEREDNS
jgi:hypothetical protein